MPQAPALYDDLSARANIAFFGGAHNVPNLAARVSEVLELTDLGNRADEPIRQFSVGMQRRVSLAAALVHNPRLLLLDEPTAAVDPSLRARFWEQFRTLTASGVTLFISTHLMDEALLCDEIAVLRHGTVIARDAPHHLLTQGKTHLTIDRQGQISACTIGGQPTDLAAALHPYGLDPAIDAVSVSGDALETVILNLIQQTPDTATEE